MGDTGIEPVTSSVSRKRSPTELIALDPSGPRRWRRDLNPCRRLCRPLPRLSATPPSHRVGPPSGRRDSNPRPSPWQGDALPTEPRPHVAGPRRLPATLGTLADPHQERPTTSVPPCPRDPRGPQRHTDHAVGEPVQVGGPDRPGSPGSWRTGWSRPATIWPSSTGAAGGPSAGHLRGAGAALAVRPPNPRAAAATALALAGRRRSLDDVRGPAGLPRRGRGDPTADQGGRGLPGQPLPARLRACR